MKDNLSKNLVFLLYGLLGLSVILSLLFYVGFIGESFLLNWAYCLILVSALAAIIFPIVYLIQNPKNAKGALMAVLALAVVAGISYGLASDEVLLKYEKYGVDESTSRNVGMGIIATYILGILSFGLIIYFGIVRMFKS